MNKNYLHITVDNVQHEYITPLDKNSELKEQLADIVDEGQYVDIHAGVKELTDGEVAQMLIDSDNVDYIILRKENVKDLISHKDNAIENYGEGAYDNDEYHDVIIHAFTSGELFSPVPKEQVIMHLLENNS